MCQPAVAVATPLRRVALGPGACDEGTSGVGMARLGDPSLTPALAPGVFRRGQAELTPEWSGVVKPGEVTTLSRAGHGDGARPPTQGLAGLDQGEQTPGLSLRLEGLLQALEACGVRGDRPDIRWEDELRRGGGTDHVGEPAQRGWAPRGPARLAAILSQQQGCEPELGRLELTEGVLAGTTEVTARFLLDRRDRDGVRAPERSRRANGTASRRAVLTRVPAFGGIKDGATTPQMSPLGVRSRERPEPPGPAA